MPKSVSKRWFQFKELSAGKNRLILSYNIYKIFGSIPLRIIAFFVVFFTFLGAREQRRASKIYFQNLEKYQNRSFRPYILASFKQFLNYGNSLVDKIISFSGNIDSKKFHFKNNDVEEINELIKNKKGIFFLTTHVGNSEILRSLMQLSSLNKPPKINVFMDKDYCKIFTDFLNKIEIDFDTETYSIDDIDVNTGINLLDKLTNSEMVYMAGDRIAKTNPEKVYKVPFLNRFIELPQGALRLVCALNVPTYFITCARNKRGFDIVTHKFEPAETRAETIEKLKKEYTEFLQTVTTAYPYQFFNFFDIFKD